MELFKLFENGLWYEEVAEQFGVSSRAVRDKAAKLEIILERKNKKKIPEIHVCIKCGKTYVKSIHIGYCSSNCFDSQKKINNLEITKQQANTNLGISILRLRKEGLTYLEIATLLDCSKSTVGYYCSSTTKIKLEERKQKFKNEFRGEALFLKHLDNFANRRKGIGKPMMCNDWNKKFRTSVSRFRHRNKMNVENKYTYREALEFLGGLQTKCYLTNTPIDLEVDNYCLDHIVPTDKGGTNELSNMGITIPSANASKTNLTLEEYLTLCQQVLENFGYKVSKE